ncbi:hypothetical protein BE21_26095 [Sorangium cellulosum]|uniref:Uncharacterized protein n=1 Tax=Sorangium cellulosum TaxID=56 RepID=A0A150TTK8_SORCE|nr:hypothetical protein BE21_26095 [Sorangium cellulosum]
MDIQQLSTIIAVLVALSVASERLVEITKGFVPYLNKRDPTTNPKGLEEPHRRAALQILAIVSAILVTIAAGPAIPKDVLSTPDDMFGLIAIGLLASGGSGLWNGVLSYVDEVKKVRSELAVSVAEPPAQHAGPERTGQHGARVPT